MKKVFVLDATAFIGGFLPECEECYTIPEVLDEIKRHNARLKADISIFEGDIRLKTPSKRDVLKVKKAAAKSGDIALLSDTDIGLLALGLGLKTEGRRPLIVTDDYDIQNMTHALGIDYLPIAERGITKIFKWKNICKGCKKIYPVDYRGPCDICGSMLIHVPVKDKVKDKDKRGRLK